MSGPRALAINSAQAAVPQPFACRPTPDRCTTPLHNLVKTKQHTAHLHVPVGKHERKQDIITNHTGDLVFTCVYLSMKKSAEGTLWSLRRVGGSFGLE